MPKHSLSQGCEEPRTNNRNRYSYAIILVFIIAIIGYFVYPDIFNVISNQDVNVAIITEDRKSMPANLKILDIKYDLFCRDNLSNLNFKKYLVIIVDYFVGVRGQEVEPLFDITSWITERETDFVQWIQDGGSLIDFSGGEGLVLSSLTVEDSYELQSLKWIKGEDVLFLFPNELREKDITSILYADAYMIGGEGIEDFHVLVNGTRGAVLIKKKMVDGKILFCSIHQDRSIFRRGLLENILEWASDGSIRAEANDIIELNSSYLLLRYPSNADSVPAMTPSLDIVVEELLEFTTSKKKIEQRITIDFSKDLDWDMGVYSESIPGEPIYIDIWQLPEISGNESHLSHIVFKEISRNILGRGEFLGYPFSEAFACIGECYSLEVLDRKELYEASKLNYMKDLRAYTDQGANFSELTPTQLTGIFLELKEEYGWTTFQKYFKLVDPSINYEKIPNNQRLNLFIYYLSKSAGQDLVPKFKNLGFPVDPLSETDEIPPKISVTSPVNGSIISTNKPTIDASLSDDILVNTTSTRIFLNDVDVTIYADITSNKVSYTPSRILPEGQNSVIVSTQDIVGNPSTLRGYFIVSSKRELTVLSEYGSVHGGGLYNDSYVATFNVSPSIIPVKPRVQQLFGGWTSSQLEGYTGPDNPGEVMMRNDITEIAQWKTQYHITVKAGKGGTTSISSGWYDAGSEITITATPQNGFSFYSWTGNGTNSYSGSNISTTLTLEGPISQRAFFSDVANPIAEAGINRTVVLEETTLFDATSSTDNDEIIIYEWDLGDGTTGSLPIVQHSYKESGTYTVKLQVKDRNGNTATDTVTITVKEKTEKLEERTGVPIWISTYGIWIFGLIGFAFILGMIPYLLTRSTKTRK